MFRQPVSTMIEPPTTAATPSRLTPLRIIGNTVVFSPCPAAMPQQVIGRLEPEPLLLQLLVLADDDTATEPRTMRSMRPAPRRPTSTRGP